MPLLGVQKKVFLFVFTNTLVCSSEGAGVDHAHHHYVPDSGHDGDPEPDGVAGHWLGLFLLTLHGGCRGCGVNAGRGVEERVFAAVVVVGRGVHKSSSHDWDLWGRQSADWLKSLRLRGLWNRPSMNANNKEQSDISGYYTVVIILSLESFISGIQRVNLYNSEGSVVRTWPMVGLIVLNKIWNYFTGFTSKNIFKNIPEDQT